MEVSLILARFRGAPCSFSLDSSLFPLEADILAFRVSSLRFCWTVTSIWHKLEQIRKLEAELAELKGHNEVLRPPAARHCNSAMCPIVITHTFRFHHSQYVGALEVSQERLGKKVEDIEEKVGKSFSEISRVQVTSYNVSYARFHFMDPFFPSRRTRDDHHWNTRDQGRGCQNLRNVRVLRVTAWTPWTCWSQKQIEVGYKRTARKVQMRLGHGSR